MNYRPGLRTLRFQQMIERKKEEYKRKEKKVIHSDDQDIRQPLDYNDEVENKI